jgi:hypothetical protein
MKAIVAILLSIFLMMEILIAIINVPIEKSADNQENNNSNISTEKSLGTLASISSSNNQIFSLENSVFDVSRKILMPTEADYYVDQNHPQASDDNPGSLDLPFLTIQHAANIMVAGDTTYIRAGIYYEHVYSTRPGNEIDGNIVFAAYPGESPVIDGTGVDISNNGVAIEHSYISLINLKVRNWLHTGIWIISAGFVEITGCEVYYVQDGMAFTDGAHDFIVSQSVAHHFVLLGFDASPDSATGTFSYNGIFNDCIAHTGIDTVNVDGFALGHGVQYNFEFNRCIAYNVWDGFDISSRQSTLNNCLAFNCWNSCYKIWEDDVRLINCIGYDANTAIVELDRDEDADPPDPSTTTILSNCTFFDAGAYTIQVYSELDTLRMQNCIIAGGNGDGIGLLLAGDQVTSYFGDYNLFHNNNTGRAIVVGEDFSIDDIANGDWTSFSGQDSHSVVAITDSELFFNPYDYDLHLTPFSPAVDNGTSVGAPEADFDGNLRPNGLGFDIGSYEYYYQYQPGFTVQPPSIDFGNVTIGSTGSEIITLTNVDTIDVIIDSMHIDNLAFSTSRALPRDIREDGFVLEPGEMRQIDIIFSPLTSQIYEGVFSIYCTQFGNETVLLTGTGIPISNTSVIGDVSGSWSIFDTVFVDGNIEVGSGNSLEINPVAGGTTIFFTGPYSFSIYGNLQARGTVLDSLYFTAQDQNIGWRGIRFYELTETAIDSSRLSFCRLEYGNATGEDDYDMGGALYIYMSSPMLIEHSTIINNHADDRGGAIHIRYSSPALRYLEISANSAVNNGGGIDLQGASPELSFCSINDNDAMIGGGIYYNEGSPKIFNTELIGNEASLHGGGLAINYLNPLDTLIMHNVLIAENYAEEGGGLHVSDMGGIMNFNNVTFTENYASLNGGGMLMYSGDPIFTNSILWNNNSMISGNQVYLDGDGADPFFNYCDIQAGLEGFEGYGAGDNYPSGNYQNCIDSDPLFFDAENGNFHLSWDNFPTPDESKSPCIDGGNPESPFDSDGTITDIGAYFFDQSGSCPVPGDVSGDNLVDVRDIVLGVACILNNTGDCPCADLDGNDNVDVIDIVLMVDIILSE